MGEPKTAGGRRRRMRSLRRQLRGMDDELALLTAEHQDEIDKRRKTDDTRRKLLVGQVVLERVRTRPPLTLWLRRQLTEGLTRAPDHAMFGLKSTEPLIPPEEWPGWPDGQTTEPKAPVRTPMTPGRRRARVAYLERRRKTLLLHLQSLTKKTAPERETRNAQRKILVGAVMLALAGRDRRVDWLRKLLNEYLNLRDRKLFELAGDGPLVPPERAASPTTKRDVPTRRASDEGSSAPDASAPDSGSASETANRGGAARSSPAGGEMCPPESESAHKEGKSSDFQEPMPRWRPCRLDGGSSTSSGARERKVKWGARLTGRAAVSALPEDLRQKTITVTTKDERSWTATIIAVVERGDEHVIVRTSSRGPSSGGGRGTRGTEGAGSSST